MKNLNKVILSIGTNIGNKTLNLQKSVELLGSKVKITKVSSIYSSEALLYTEQVDFYNLVLEIIYEDSPQNLLKILKKIEEDMGREQNFRYGPRIIDLDIIFFNNQIVSEENLQIPHYDWQNRKFVIEPLYEILNKELVEEEFNISGQKVEVVGTI
jgi:2-amino-4-hydroxy-6-hydroxymethyldihydropteridine diphosphokinase